MTAKTNKSVLKRIKITKSGKMLSRGVGLNHFQAKKRRTKQLNHKHWRSIDNTESKVMASYLRH